MPILKYEENKDGFKNFLKEKIQQEEVYDDYDYFYGRYDYDYILENLDKKPYNNLKLITNDKNEITNFFFEKTENNLIIIDLDDNVSKEVLIENITELKKNYNSAFIEHSYDIAELKILKNVNLDSNLKEGAQYHLKSPLMSLHTKDINTIRNYIETKEFPEFTSNLNSEVIENNKFLKEKYEDKYITGYWYEDSGSSLVKTGFHYFGQDDNPDKKDKIFTIKDNDNIVGVIKYGIYKDFHNNGIGDHYAFCFIDVKNPYRGNGISKKLIEEFGKQLEKENKENGTNYPLYLTQESRMGKMCNIKNNVINLIKNTEILYENHSTYELERFLNGKKIEKQKEKDIEL